uniref:Uncharacterized protein n=1 Tax=Oryza brachyantha TaxID=4533 RepID=J3LLU0_ORYBR
MSSSIVYRIVVTFLLLLGWPFSWMVVMVLVVMVLRKRKEEKLKCIPAYPCVSFVQIHPFLVPLLSTVLHPLPVIYQTSAFHN